MEEMKEIAKGDFTAVNKEIQNGGFTAVNKAMTRLWTVAKKKKEFAIKIKGSAFMWQREEISFENCTTGSIQTFNKNCTIDSRTVQTELQWKLYYRQYTYKTSMKVAL